MSDVSSKSAIRKLGQVTEDHELLGQPDVSGGPASQREMVLILETSLGTIALSPDDFRMAHEAAGTIIGASIDTEAGSAKNPLVNAQEIARLLGIKPSWVLQRAREGRLPCITIGKYVRFDVEAVIRYFQRDREDI